MNRGETPEKRYVVGLGLTYRHAQAPTRSVHMSVGQVVSFSGQKEQKNIKKNKKGPACGSITGINGVGSTCTNRPGTRQNGETIMIVG